MAGRGREVLVGVVAILGFACWQERESPQAGSPAASSQTEQAGVSGSRASSPEGRPAGTPQSRPRSRVVLESCADSPDCRAAEEDLAAAPDWDSRTVLGGQPYRDILLPLFEKAPDGPIGEISQATLVCRVKALKPEKAMRAFSFGDDPDMVVTINFGALPEQRRHTPDDTAIGWFAVPLVSVKPQAHLRVDVKDRDSNPPTDGNGEMGKAEAQFDPQRPFELRSDDIFLACRRVDDTLLKDAANRLNVLAVRALKKLEARPKPGLHEAWRGFPRQAEWDFFRSAQLLAQLLGWREMGVQSLVQRHRTAARTWTESIQAMALSLVPGGQRPGEVLRMEGTPLEARLLGLGCGSDLPSALPEHRLGTLRRKDEQSACVVRLRIRNASAQPSALVFMKDIFHGKPSDVVLSSRCEVVLADGSLPDCEAVYLSDEGREFMRESPNGLTLSPGQGFDAFLAFPMPEPGRPKARAALLVWEPEAFVKRHIAFALDGSDSPTTPPPSGEPGAGR
jgi:hypothetical protein